MEDQKLLKIGVQSQNIIYDQNQQSGFEMLKRTKFDCCDFSLNSYLKNTDIYGSNLNNFYDKTESELERFFSHHKSAARESGITINQMHMPYPVFVPSASKEYNDYLGKTVAQKSMKICSFFECPNIVIHGLKLRRQLGSEEKEWNETEKFLDTIAPYAVQKGITICIENLYESLGGHIVEGPCCDAVKAVQRIDRINEKYGAEVLGFCYDTGHANLLGLDHYDFITTLGSRLKVLHIHDNDGISDLHQIPYTFTRTRENNTSTDWDGFISGLKDIHFNGVLSFETAPVLNSFPAELKYDALMLISRIGYYFIDRIS